MTQPQPRAVSAPRAVRAQAFGNDLVGAALLSAVAGYVDTAGFLALYGLFTAHVTGDLVTAGVVVAEHFRTGAATRLAMIPVFMLSVAATALFARALKRRGREPLTALLAVMTLALAIFGTTGVALRGWASAPDDWGVAIIGGTGVIAMAIQNTLMRDALSSFCPTTIMTGNLTQVTIDLVDVFLPAPGGASSERASRQTDAAGRLKRFGIPLLGFMLGGALGAVLTHALGLWSIALPTAVVGALTGVAWRMAKSARAAIVHDTAAVHNTAAVHDRAAVHNKEERLALVPTRVTAARHASGTQLVEMQPPAPPVRVLPQSGTYSKAEPISAEEAPVSSRTAANLRRARS
jgi:uncharacterized membrane protein YoaK (UPF0700 family)